MVAAVVCFTVIVVKTPPCAGVDEQPVLAIDSGNLSRLKTSSRTGKLEVTKHEYPDQGCMAKVVDSVLNYPMRGTAVGPLALLLGGLIRVLIDATLGLG